EGQGASQHTMRPLGGDWLSSDGTAIREHITQTSQGPVGVIIDARGVTHSGPSGYPIVDPNGNTITDNLSSSPQTPTAIIGWTDSVGRYVPNVGAVLESTVPPEASASLTTDYTGCTGALPIAKAYLWNVPGEGGPTVQYKVCFVSLTFTTTSIPNCASPNCSVS